MAADFRNILVIKTSSLGDVLHALPAVCALRDRFPKARLTWLVDDRYAGLLRGHPAIDSVIPAWSPPLPAGLPLEHIVRAAFQYSVILRLRIGFDVVIDLQGLFRTAVLAAAAGGRMRVGFADARELAPLVYTHRVDVGGRRHAVERCLRVAGFLGAAEVPLRFGLSASPGKAEPMLRRGGLPAGAPYVVVAPASSTPAKDWRADGYAAIIGDLWRRRGLHAVLIGGSRDEASCRRIAAESGSPAVVVTGAALEESAAIIAGGRLFLGGDSGPLHLAVALGRPVVAVFGPTDPLFTGPWGRDEWVVRQNAECPVCRAGRTHRSAGHTCLGNLSAGAVLEKADAALSAIV